MTVVDAVVAEIAPTQAEVLVANTWDCNLRCSYCFVQRGGLSVGGGRMPPSRARRVIDALDEGLAQMEAIGVHLYGGEPLTHLPAIEAMVDRVAAKPPGRFSFCITTNGTVLNDRVVELLQRGRFSIVLSIDGPAEVHDQCRRTARGQPTHARVIEFLETVRARTDCEVRGSSVVRPGRTLAAANRYLHTLPVDHIKAQAVRVAPGAPGGLSVAERQAYLDDLEAVGRQVIACLERGETPRDDRFSSRILQLLARQHRRTYCNAGVTVFGITPEGDVLPCLLMNPDDCRLGNIDEPPHTWVEAGRQWRRAQAMRPECRDCPSLPLCGGGCPAMMPLCGADECELTRKNCEVATAIYEHFQSRPEALLALAGIT